LIAGNFGDVKGRDGDNLYTVLAKVLDHLLEMRKALAVDREQTVLFMVIDVEINHVGGNVSFTELAGDLAHARFRIVAIAALLVAERKQRRQGRRPYQRSEIAH